LRDRRRRPSCGMATTLARGPITVKSKRQALVRYRRARSARRPDIVDGLLDQFAEPGQLRAGAVWVGDPLVVLPHLFHLLWSGALVADLEGELLHSETVVWTRGTSR
ncbi:hypothetical protein ABZ567_31960, partial [Streptomyces sp. NPDC016459]